jgi:hypothetical protein
LAPVCSTVAAGGPANTSVMAPLKARRAVWAGVAGSGQQPQRNECELVLGGRVPWSGGNEGVVVNLSDGARAGR